MLAAIRKVAGGGRYVTPATAEALAAAVGAATTRNGTMGVDALSHRGRQVFRLLATGHSVSQIGAQLKLASKAQSAPTARAFWKRPVPRTM